MNRYWEIRLDKHCAYCGMYFPNSDIKDLITKEDWENRERISTCEDCKYFLEQMTEDRYRQVIFLLDTPMLENWAYQLATRFNRVVVKDTPVQFYYEKKAEEKEALHKSLNEIFKGER